ncbi:MAG TPA: hypothetical protein PKY70_05180 [Nakamurella multipartita]|nr:hypothetical protein [Nakamurella multipartita]
MRADTDAIGSNSRTRRGSPTPVLALLVAALTVLSAFALSTQASGSQQAATATTAAATTETVALRAKVNNKYVTAGSGGNSALTASRTSVGQSEKFELIRVNSTDVYLRALANGKYVCAESAGNEALISNRTATGQWEKFQLINNSDGTTSLRARANNKIVTAGSAGTSPLIANRTSIGRSEKFDLVTQTSTGPTSTAPSTTTSTRTATPTPTATQTSTSTSTSTSRTTTSVSSTTSTPASGSWPGAGTTGVPAGTALTAYTGPSIITESSTTIAGKRITSCLEIKARNVVIRNSLIQSNCFFNVLSEDSSANLQLIDVEIDGGNNLSGDSAVGGSGYSCLRCNIHGTVDGFKAGTNVTIRDSYIHDLAIGNDSHNDGVQSLGTTSLNIIHNRIVLKDGATAAIILSTGSADQMKNILIQDNLLGGGAYTVYGGYEAGRDVLSRVSNIQILQNRFTTEIFPRSGAYGPLTSTDSPVVTSGNVWHDGAKAGQGL